jgi:uncharacterized membrane protein
MPIRFLIYGLFGWCAEIVWTAAYDVGAALRAGQRIDARLAGRTYLWMLPIYGGGGLAFEVAHRALAPHGWPLLARGLIYMVGCFVVEYVSGWIIKQATGRIPWDYSYARWHVHGLIRLDYAPVWFGFGLALEIVERAARAIEPALRAAY